MRPRLLALVLTVSLSVLAACSDDAPASSGDGPTSEATSESNPPSPTESTTVPPGVEPASGPLIELDAISAKAPKGWSQEGLKTDSQVTAEDPKYVNRLTLFQVPDPSNGAGGVEQAAKDAVAAGSYLQMPKILEPTEINGVEVFHIGGRVDSSGFIEEFGTTVDGQFVRVSLFLVEIISAKERQAIVDSVLPTVELG